MSTTQPSLFLDYALVDVFAERALEGNMLAIFTDARGLSTGQMQALARETNLAETTFIFPAGEDSGAAGRQPTRVRIFTTQEELPFAGHPTLGTAAWLYSNHPALRDGDSISLALNSGVITVQFQLPGAGEEGVFGTMRQQDAVFGSTHEPQAVARALNLPLEDLDLAFPIQTVSTGMPFCIVPIRSLSAIERLAIPQAAAERYLDASDAKFFYCLTPAQTPGVHFHARMQFYNGEDPATGSASGCAISWLVRNGLVPSGQPTILEQGIEIRRPARIHVRATRAGDRVQEVFVGGRTIPVASGRFFLPSAVRFPQPAVTNP